MHNRLYVASSYIHAVQVYSSDLTREYYHSLNLLRSAAVNLSWLVHGRASECSTDARWGAGWSWFVHGYLDLSAVRAPGVGNRSYRAWPRAGGMPECRGNALMQAGRLLQFWPGQFFVPANQLCCCCYCVNNVLLLLLLLSACCVNMQLCCYCCCCCCCCCVN